MAPPTDRPSFPPAVLEALRKGNKLEAIKLLRLVSKGGLAEAKALVDLVQKAQASNKEAAAPAKTKAASAVIHHVHTGYQYRGRPGLSPGEVPPTGGPAWWIVVLLVGIAAILVLG